MEVKISALEFCQYRPKRDLIGEWAKACRTDGMRFGVTFHHEYTWWWWQTAFGSDKEGDKKGFLTTDT
jgi:alpha-L-fucosidase